jgi:glyoxylase-like metal-dependent hydrolase (beta-lactamase superfamily II)
MNKLTFLILVLMTIGGAQAQNSDEIRPAVVGDFRVYLLSEGQQMGNAEILIGATPEMLAQALPNGTYPTAVNAFLIQTAGRNILVDAGFGRQLFRHLEALHLRAEDISDILITHMHGDHIAGLVRNGERRFPHAEVYIAQAERDYWATADNRTAQEVLTAYQDRLRLFVPNHLEALTTAVLPDIFPVAAVGHTPGHTAFLLQSGDARFLIWGDLMHAAAIQLRYPQVAVTYDVDPGKAVETREYFLQYVVDNGIPVAGMHLAGTGMGVIRRLPEGGYDLNPLNNN